MLKVTKDIMNNSNKDNLKIIKMDISHIKQIAELEKLCFSDPWSINSIQEELNKPMSVFYVLILNLDTNTEIVVGYLGLYNILGEGYITNICVHPEYRCLGYASMLINKVIDYSNQNNLDFITLEVRESNCNAINLYKKFGFKEVGLRKNYYSKPSENAVIMTRY